MIRLIASRLVGGIFVVFVVASLAFLILHAAPGGPFDGERTPSKEAQKNIERVYKLKDPLHVQYYDYISRLAKLDLGPTMKRRQNVNEIISNQAGYSIRLGVVALSFAMFFGIALGVTAASRRNTSVDYGFMSMALLGISIPSIVLGPLLQNWFSMKLGWAPMARAEGWGSFILPGMTLGMIYTGTIARLARGGMLEVLGQDYIRTARAKGLSERAVVWKHGVRIGLIPVITYLGPATAALLSGSFVVEKIYQIPGLGFYFIASIPDRDYPLLAGVMVFYVSILVLLNLLVDVLYGFLDPRIRERR